jgi:hypothetical protein
MMNGGDLYEVVNLGPLKYQDSGTLRQIGARKHIGRTSNSAPEMRKLFSTSDAKSEK